MIGYEEQVEMVKKVTEGDPKMQSLCIKIMEIEKDYPNEEALRLELLDELIKKSVEEDIQ